MSSKSANHQEKGSKINRNLKSSIVHKPFATGTINIFNPYKSKQDGELSQPKLFLNAELEEFEATAELTSSDLAESESMEVEYRSRNWIDSLLSVWGISAIAILVSVNLISAGAIWRNLQTANPQDNSKKSATIGDANLAEREFMPLNLSTLSKIEPNKKISVEDSAELVPIPPALAPLNDLSNLSAINSEYHYILTEYTGDQALSLARQQVKQVSLVNFPQGVFIYLGAFRDRQAAEQFVSKLKQDSLTARVYPFE